MKKPILGAAVAVSLLLVAGCGSPTSSTDTAGDTSSDESAATEAFDTYNSMSGEARTKALVEAAEEEGELNLYTSNTDIDDIVEAFSDKYDVDVNVYRANGETVLQRVLQEDKANYAGADLIETDSGELNVMVKEGLLYDYEGALRDAVRPEGQRDGWTADRFNVFVIAWNTNLVKPGDEPTSLKDLADPRWKGQASIELGDVDWFAAMYLYYKDQGMSDDEIMDFFTAMAKNVKVVKGHTVQGELLSAGQFSVAASLYSHTVDKAAADGAPVTWHNAAGDPLQPLVIRANGAGLMRTATHPAAAVLFMDFLLSDAQDLLGKSFRIGSVPGASDPLAGYELITPPEDELLSNPEKWDGLYEKVTSAGSE